MSLKHFFYTVLTICLWSGAGRAQSQVDWVGALPEQIQESSGLLILGDKLLTHNDSGSSPELFFLDSVSLQIRATVRIENAVNTDWEALAQDDEYIYIGDIGNNLGNRRDLQILRVPKSELMSSETVKADVISFRYEDQTDFSSSQYSDWDAEALLAGPDALWIFTKQWQSQGTVIYEIPKNPGEHLAIRKGSLEVKGLITGASGIPDGSGLILSGYSRQLQPFVIQLKPLVSENAFQQQFNKQQVAVAFGQVEGITVGQNGSVFLSSEAFSNKLTSLPAGIYTFLLDSNPGADKPVPNSGNNP